MPAKIRLARHGKKHNAFYHIVVADGRAPRDGKYIEKIGTYNPNTNPATIDIDSEKAISWLNKGAQPTDTARAILSYKGVLFKKHLQAGVQLGKSTQEQADAKFETWKQEKEGKISAKQSDISSKNRDIAKANLALELKAKEAKAEAIRIKNTPPPEPEPEVAPAVEPTTEPTTEPTAEATPDAPVTPETPQEPQA
jgi:small subunit ribosomal protein S16